MTYLAILILMLVAFTLVGWPLISSSRSARGALGGGSPWDDLITQRDAAYQALQELEFEHQLGNLSEADYRDLRERYRSQAAAILRELDQALRAAGADKAMARGGAAPSAVAWTVSPAGGLACPSCGQATEAMDRYCWSCGAQLGQRCANCGGPVQSGDRFCVGCGAHLEAA